MTILFIEAIFLILVFSVIYHEIYFFLSRVIGRFDGEVGLLGFPPLVIPWFRGGVGLLLPLPSLVVAWFGGD